MGKKEIGKNLRKGSNRSFLARDYESLRSQMIQHARTFFPDKIQDFSEAGFGGLMVDIAASVGDNLSFYLDHEFREMDPLLAVELDNVLMHLKNAGVNAFGAAPASVNLVFSIEVPAEKTDVGHIPKISALPVLLQGTTALSFNGIIFTTLDDLDFSELDINGNLVCDYSVLESSTSGKPLVFKVTRAVAASSGEEEIETFIIPDSHVPFRELTLSKENISLISNVYDSDGSNYYEVTALSQDTVFVAVKNTNKPDAPEVPSNLEIVPAPRRFVKSYRPTTRITKIRFGSGDVDVLDDDIIPDPSDLSLDLYGRKYTPRFSIDPNSLMKTQTLGISPKNTVITVRYRHGGGISHNVGIGSIIEIGLSSLEFRNSPIGTDALGVRQSLVVTNNEIARGGANAPSIEDLRTLITSARSSQSRVVTREDLLARIFTMPSTFGRVYRASIAPNPQNSLSSVLYIITKNKKNELSVAPDTLKKNLSKYLNEFRLISDAIDILDGQVINFGVKYGVVISGNINKIQVVQNINNKISNILDNRFFQIDQPIIMDDITNIVINTDYVIALTDLSIFTRVGSVEGRGYSDVTFSIENSSKNGIIFGPVGSIFELKFPEHDIIGSAM